MDFFRRRREKERDMQEEIQSLRELQEHPGELGNLTLTAENARAEWTWRWLESFLQDARYALRQLRANPAFAAVVILMLAAGIGANASIFAQIDAVFWQQLPVREPQQLRELSLLAPPAADRPIAPGSLFPYPKYEALSDGARDSVDLACWATISPVRPVVVPELGRIEAQMVSGNYFQMLGVVPAVGRALTPEDDGQGAERVTVISFGLYQRMYGADPKALGRTISFNGTSYTIAGVMPAGFFGVDPSLVPDAWAPVRSVVAPATLAASNPYGDPGLCRLIGRPRQGVSDEQLRQSAESILATRIVMAEAGQGVETLRRRTGIYLFVVMGVTGILLLLICTNLAGLLLAKGAAREREIATRLAVGAGRGRILRQLTTESLVLSLAGGLLAVPLALALGPYLSSMLPRLIQTPLGNAPALGVAARWDWRVLAFTAMLTVCTAVLFGLAPALRASRTDLSAAMKKGSGGRFHFTSGKILVAMQAALSLALLIGAGLLLRSVDNLKSVPLGYNPEGLLAVRIEPRYAGYGREPRNDFFVNAVQRLEQIPGVLSASGSVIQPIGGVNATLASGPCPKGPGTAGPQDVVAFNAVGPRFFETWRWPVIAGREIAWSDRGAPPVALVNEAFSRKYYADRNPVGEKFRGCADSEGWTIVGVVADTRSGPRAEQAPVLFPAFWQVPTLMTLVIRTSGNPAALVANVRAVLAEIDPRVFIVETTLPAQLRDSRIAPERLLLVLLGAFAGLSMVISCLGLAGTLAYVVSRRTGEIGIRIALGAQRSDVAGMVARETLVPVLAGVAAGAAGSFALTGYIKSLLFGVTGNDPYTFAGAVLIFLTAAALGAAIPTRRAVRVDPMEALRHE